MNYEISNFPLDLALNLVNIIVMFVLVRLLAWKPVKKFLDERRQKLDEQKSQAQEAMTQAQAMKDEYAAKMEQAAQQAQAQADEILAKAQERADRMVALAHEQADEILAKGRERMEAEREDALKSIQEETVTMALDIAALVLKRSISDQDTQNMANRFFQEIGNPASHSRDDEA